jgi:hypothetical protein
MKTIVTIILLSILLPFAGMAQGKQKAEQEFVAELNSIIINSKPDEWPTNTKMSIDSVFAINTAGILSLNIRYTKDDSSYVKVRMEAAVNKIWRIAYDLYLLLEFKDEEVSVYKSDSNSNG